jgi:hypothetical protein
MLATNASVPPVPAVRGAAPLIPANLPAISIYPSVNKLLKENSLSTSSLPEIKGLNETFSWQVARICALYEAIYQQGVVTEDDLPKLQAAEQQLKNLSQSLPKGLVEPEKARLAGAFGQAESLISETRALIQELRRYDKRAAALNAAQDSCMNSCYDPHVKGGTLQSVGKLKAIFSAFNTLRVYVEKKDKPENIAQRIEILFQGEAEALEWLVEEWTEHFKETVDQEFKELKKAFTQTKDAQYARQLQALLNQLKQSAGELKMHRDLRTITAPLPQLQTLLDNTREHCASCAQKIQALLAEQDLLEPLNYGSAEWQELAQQRPARKEAKVEQFQSWSQTRKDWVARLFAAMQLTAGILDAPSSSLSKKAAGRQAGAQDLTSQDLTSQDLTSKEIALLIEPQPLTSAAPRTTSWAASLIHQVGSYFKLVAEPSIPSAPAFVEKTAAKGYVALREGLAQLQEMQTQAPRFPASELTELRQEIALLRRELLKIAADTPEPTCPLLPLAEWYQAVEDKCYAVQVLETRISDLMEASRKNLSLSPEELSKYGKKHENLVLMAMLVEALQIPGVYVPRPQGISSDAVRAFLEKTAPAVFEQWNALGTFYSNYKGQGAFLDQPKVKQHLKAIDQGIAEAFAHVSSSKAAFQALGLPDAMRQWLKLMQQHDHYLMVRSTGAEDSRQTANAGGNLSKAYVSPEQAALLQSVGEVVQSYFGAASLQNRLNAGQNPFKQELKLAVTAQELIGEKIGGAKNAREIPRSLVLFTNEPLYIGNEKFRVMRISATYGHGEGVVGNRGIATDTALLLISEAHPDRVYTLYDNQAKPTRLAPIATPEGISLEKIANPPELQRQRVLDDTLLKKLYHWGVVGEKFFNNEPTDMEIVIKDGVIYPVQARRVNRRPMLPTYLDLRKLTALPRSPILGQLKGEMIVPGKASVLLCTKPSEVLFAPTLEQAEKMYREDSGVKLVVVAQQEPANSHPVVNFSNLGVSCLYMPDAEQVQKMIAGLTPDQPLAACVQTATLQTLDKKLADPAKLISEGFAVHPAKIAISLPLEERLAKASTPSKVPQEIKDLLLDLRSAATAETASAKLKELQAHGWIRQLKTRKEQLQAHMQQLKIVPHSVHETVRFLEKLQRAVDAAFAETHAQLQHYAAEKRLKPLFHAKALEKVLFDDASKHAGVGRYTISELEPILEATQAQIDYQKQLPHAAHFADILPAGYQGLSKEAETSWTQFLLELEPLASSGQISSQQVRQLKQFVATLEKAQALPAWLTFFFPSASGSPLEKLQHVLKGLPPEQGPFIQQLLAQKERMQELRSQQDAFGDPKKFDQVWPELQKITEGFHLESQGLFARLSQLAFGGEKSSTLSLKQQLAAATPITWMMAVKTMQDLVDLFDGSIKAMKSGADWTPEEKTKKFKVMLQPYFALLENWLLQFEQSKTIPVAEFWSIDTYLARMKAIMRDTPDNHADQLRPSQEFSVSAAVLGAKTAFERHYPQKLEDLFTLIHQNLIVCTTAIDNVLVTPDIVQHSTLPATLKAALENLTQAKFGRAIQRIGFDVTEKHVNVHYNVPLRNHSGKLILSYDKFTGETILTGQLLGQARSRWPLVARMGTILSEAGVLPFSKALVQGNQEVIFTWKIENEQMLKIALEEYGQMAEISMEMVSNNIQIDLMFERRKTPALLNYMAEHSLASPSIYTSFLKGLLEKEHLSLDTSDEQEKRSLVVSVIFSETTAFSRLKEFFYETLYSKDIAIQEKKINEDQTLSAAEKRLLLELLKDKEHMELILLDTAHQWVSGNKLDEGIAIYREFVKHGNKIPEVMRAIAPLLDHTSIVLQTEALRISASLVPQGYVLEEAAKRLESLTLAPDLELRDKAWDLFFALEQSGNKMPQIIEHVKNEAMEPSAFQEFALEGLNRLVLKGYVIPEALQAAQEGLTRALSDTKLQVGKRAWTLLTTLIENGQQEGLAIAINAAEKGFENYGLHIAALDWYEWLISRGHAIPETVKAATAGIQRVGIWEEDLDHPWLLCKILVEKGHGISEIVNAVKSSAERAVKDPDLKNNYNKALGEWFPWLVSKGYGIPEAIEAVQKGMPSNIFYYKSAAFKSLRALAKAGHMLPQALEAAQKEVNNRDMMFASLELFDAMVEVEYGIPEAIEATKVWLHSSADSFKPITWQLLNKLALKGHGIQVVIEEARKAIKKGDRSGGMSLSVRASSGGMRYALSAMASLVNHRHGIPDIRQTCHEIIKAFPNTYESKQAENILQTLKDKGY